ncbi:UNVERIFIED_CONTAM: hypothetical protein H355_011529, partial [Colinus virginianus]
GAAERGQDPALEVVFRQPSTGRAVTWTGPGFARVPNGAGLRFDINNIPLAMDFTIAIRYEPEDWMKQLNFKDFCYKVVYVCYSLLDVRGGTWIALLQTPVCLEPGAQYNVDAYFSQPSASDPKAKSFILIDSLGLIPRINSMENLCSKKDLDDYQKYHCVEIASEVGPHVLPEACTRLIASMSARLHHGAVGTRCDECPSGFYRISGSSGEECAPCPCNNNIDLTDPESCNRVTGECIKCLHNTHGANCQFCKPGYFGSALNQDCQTCNCNPKGTSWPQCDKATGMCNCRAGVTGRFCDQCGRGFEKDFPSCHQCHLCFDEWDTEITALAQTVQGLMRFAANLEDKGGRMPSCDMRFKAFEDAISETERILNHPVFSLEALSSIKDFHGYVQQKITQMAQIRSTPYEFPDLTENIEDIGEEAGRVYELVQQKLDLHRTLHYLSFKEVISNIKKHFEVSFLAEEKARETALVIRHSEHTRQSAIAVMHKQAWEGSKVLEQLKLIKIPDIQQLVEKICVVPGNHSCSAAACGGGPKCSGALQLSFIAFRKAEETAVLLMNLTNQLQEPENQVESIRNMAEDTKLKGSHFNGELERAKNQIKIDRDVTKEFIRKVKNFLSDESVPPEDIEQVASYVLQINLPLTPRELTSMLGKIRSIMAHCEKYNLNTKKRNRKMEVAQTLLMEAQAADKAAKALPPVDEINDQLKNIVSSQGRSKNALIKLNEEIQGIRAQISQAGNQMNKTSDELNDFSAKQSTVEDEIATLQMKMLMNRNRATKVRTGAEAAYKRAQKIDNEFADIKRKYTILQDKLKAKGPPKTTNMCIGACDFTLTDLEKLLQDLNETKQDKAEQLRQLEEQVIAIKNEITEQESKYSTCKS